MNLIAAVDENWGIGYENQLLARIPADLRYFREKTIGRTVVYGRKTMDTFPGGRPLPGRTNIVLSRNPGFSPEGAITCGTVPEALAKLAKYPPEDIFIIGGESIYKEFLPYCQRAYITKIHAVFPCDAYLENLDMDGGWLLREKGGEMIHQCTRFSFDVYERRQAI